MFGVQRPWRVLEFPLLLSPAGLPCCCDARAAWTSSARFKGGLCIAEGDRTFRNVRLEISGDPEP